MRKDAAGRAENETKVGSGGSWHTDIEYEVEPIYVSMFLVHKAPVSRKAKGGTWVTAPAVRCLSSRLCIRKTTSFISHLLAKQGNADGYFDGSDEELMRLRRDLPLNGETAFADTAAAFAALDAAEQAALELV